jgi:Polyketide cyclase / dehydrase and lipid transport
MTRTPARLGTRETATSAPAALPRSRTGRFHLDAARERVFPLFTARGEREWAPGWDPLVLSGGEERGSAFETRNAEGRSTTWIVVEHRPAEGRASYARLAHGSNIGLVDVLCTDAAGGTDVSVTYTLTALQAEAQAYVAAFLEPRQYESMMNEWRAATAAALVRLGADTV